MATTTSHEQLVDFLEARAWAPVLQASPRRYPKERHPALREVQRAVARHKARLERDVAAAEVRAWFTRSLTDRESERLREQLVALDLPALPDVADEFLELCDALGVPAEA